MTKILRHAIGKSTLNEGFAIPRRFEDWIQAPSRGHKREIHLIFEGIEINATLRRIDNDKGSVQVKYENKDAQPLRDRLSSVFSETKKGPCGEYFELIKIDENHFKIIPFPANEIPNEGLTVENWLFHGAAEKIMERTPVIEIPAIIRAIPFQEHEGQTFYNHVISIGFQEWDWASERRVIPDLALKCDFAKERVQVEIEFGNARTYYQDFMKFLLGHHNRYTDIGVLVVPTGPFAKHLCHVGKSKAQEKGRSRYSGMIDFDKVQREYKYFEFIMQMPIIVIGIGSVSHNYYY